MPKPKYTIKHVIKYINNLNGVLLNKVYKTTKTILKIKCIKCNHIWETNYKRIKQGKWCPRCAGHAPYSYTEIKNEVIAKNGTLLSIKIGKMVDPLLIRCNICKYKWKMIAPNWRKGHWCPNCAGNAPTKYEEITKYVEKNNGILVSNKYTPGEKIEIICNVCERKWKQYFPIIKCSNSWCPRCNKSGGKQENKLLLILKTIFNEDNYIIKDGYNQFDWLYNPKTKCKQHLDFLVYRKNGNIICAIERNGEQHYRPVRFGGISNKEAEINFIKNKKRDRRKRYLLNKYKNIIQKFIIFGYKEKLTVNNVKIKLKNKGVVW